MKSLGYAITSSAKVPYRGGRPLWPVAGLAELAALRRTTALFGARLKLTEPDSYENAAGEIPRSEEGAALVAYPHPKLRPLSELYARLTSRTSQLLSLDQVESIGPEVVICLWEHLSLEILEALHRACLERPLGVLVAGNVTDLRERLIRSAAAAALDPPRTGKIVIASGRLAHAKRNEVSHQELATGVLLHVGHSDGLDVNFTKHEVFCAVSGNVRTRRGWTPPCVTHNHCYRLDLPRDRALRDSRLLQPQHLHARAAVFMTCFGISASDTIVPPSWSPLEGLLRTPSLGCIVTALGIAMPAVSHAQALWQALVSGHTIGNVLYRNSLLSHEDHARCRLLLFGDPRTRPILPPEGECHSYPTTSAPLSKSCQREQRPASVWTSKARRAFLMDIVRVGTLSHAEVADRWARMWESRGAEPTNDDEFAICLDGLAPLWDHWVANCPLPRLRTDRTLCPGCGRAGQVFAYEWAESAKARLLKMCVRCGIFEDAESASRLAHFRPQMHDGILEIPDAVSDAWVMIRLKDDLRRSYRWTLPPGLNRRQIFSPQKGIILLGAGLATTNIIYLRNFEMVTFQLRP